MLKSTSDAEAPQSRRLASAVAESALLASRLLFFDLAQEDAAEQFFQLADDAASTSQDHALAAAVLGHRAFVPGFARQLEPARNYLSAAHAHARYGAGPLLRSWLHCVDVEVSARVGQPRASLTRIRSAEDALMTAGTDPTWLDFFDASRLDGFAGNALLLAGRNREAAGRLQNALDNLAETATKQKFNTQINKIRWIIEQAIANFKTWRIMHTDYRRPIGTFSTTISTVIALHFYSMA